MKRIDFLTLFAAVGASDAGSIVEPMSEVNSIYSRSTSAPHYSQLTRVMIHLPNSPPLELVRMDLTSPTAGMVAVAYTSAESETL